MTGTNPSGTSSGGVPASGVAAVVLNVTATGEAAQGFLTVWPPGAAQPSASSLNYRPDKTVPNLVTVGLSAIGQVSFYSLQGTDLVVDVEGYYAAPDAAPPGSSTRSPRTGSVTPAAPTVWWAPTPSAPGTRCRPAVPSPCR